MMEMGYGKHLVEGGRAVKGVGETSPATSLAQLGVPGPVLVIRPNESAVQSGREIKLSIVDGRIDTSDRNVFKFEYDPKVLQFKRLSAAEVVSPSDLPSEDQWKSEGSIAFRLVRPRQHAPRSASIIFVARAPGVSPVRVELTDPEGTTQTSPEVIGTGVVTVR